MLARLVSAAIGIWLMAAPAVLDYGRPAADVDRVLGPIAAALSVIAISEVVRGLRWLVLVPAALLVLLPLPLGYDGVATLNSLISGLALGALALLGPAQRYRYGEGWRGLFD